MTVSRGTDMSPPFLCFTIFNQVYLSPHTFALRTRALFNPPLIDLTSQFPLGSPVCRLRLLSDVSFFLFL